MIAQKTDTFENVTLTVRTKRGADVWDEVTVKSKLPSDERTNHEYRTDQFIEFVTSTISVDGDIGFAWPTLAANAEATYAAYLAWCDMSPKLMIFWSNLIFDVNRAPLPEENLIPGNA